MRSNEVKHEPVCRACANPWPCGHAPAAAPTEPAPMTGLTAESEAFAEEIWPELRVPREDIPDRLAAIERAAVERALSVERVAEALAADGAVFGVAQRYGRLNDAYYEHAAARIVAALLEGVE